ncbi:hypothetical protein [Serinibacter salmoneus]|uniref:hypothetical protein n=1 Tax=Serinibacter salmoneus TaxID=556530 RepID=UPI00117A77ED|nr:hypothetical protein [Serinibacter salmoneus]
MGMVHQKNILMAAFKSCGKPEKFDAELTRLFGSPFRSVSADPVAGESVRRKDWQPVASATPQKQCSQIEQRIVDVAVRDVLRIVHLIPKSSKVDWVPLLEGLTCRTSWSDVARQVQAFAGRPDRASGFFWSSALAATLGAWDKTRPTAAPRSSDIAAFPGSQSTVFKEVRHPRARSGNTVKTIKEVADPLAFNVAAETLAAALSRSSLPMREGRAVVAVIGSVTSADLWRHPAAVRYLLIPAIGILRRDFSGTFSLDSQSRLTEQIIEDELVQKWRARGVW